MILVTGVSGFIGSRLLQALVTQYGRDNVLALTSAPISQCRFLLHHNYNFSDDYLIGSGYDAISTIIHAGAFTPKRASDANDIDSCNSNISNTLRVLRLHSPQLKKLIFLSTLDVYGNDNIISEKTIIDPISLYGYSKLYCERMIAAWATGDVLVHVLRVGHIYGPGEEAYQKLIPVIMRKLLSGQPLQLYGSGNERRSFLYVDDLVNALLKVVALDRDIGVTNLVGGRAISIKELIDVLIGIAGVSTPIEQIPAANEPRDLIFDNTKMQLELGVTETALEQGLELEWQYMKSLASEHLL